MTGEERELCTNCDDTGWVCESHHDRPWGGVSNAANACECGPGDPCPVCNPCSGRDDPPRMPPGSRTIIDKDGWRH